MATALAGAVPALAQQQGAAKQYVSGDTSNAPPGASGLVVVGTVTEISGSVVLVEEDSSAESGGKGFFTVTDATEITLRRDGGSVAAAFGDLAVGQTVEAAYAGAVAESYPTQGHAATIAILEDFDCPFPGGCKDPGQPPEEVAATGVIEPLADNADAEHGITDEATGTFYALQSSAVDLDDYANGGQRVAIYGTLAQTFVATEHPVLEVSRVEVLDGTQQPPPPPPGDVATSRPRRRRRAPGGGSPRIAPARATRRAAAGASSRGSVRRPRACSHSSRSPSRVPRGVSAGEEACHGRGFATSPRRFGRATARPSMPSDSSQVVTAMLRTVCEQVCSTVREFSPT